MRAVHLTVVLSGTLSLDRCRNKFIFGIFNKRNVKIDGNLIDFESWRLAAMEAGGKYRIQNYGESIYDVLVTVNSINGKEAYITISTDEPFPTESPTGAPTPPICEPNFTKFQLFLTWDEYGAETSWIIKGKDGTVVGESIAGRYYDNYSFVIPSDDEYYCLQDGECYTFTINDSSNDGGVVQIGSCLSLLLALFNFLPSTSYD